ncbi:DNA polymerase [Azospirillum lipoferum]|uniref:Type-4 uracil-DNA glycosylase n=1 Tax=Azospirillum lipoferum TaxID=193 RepID=A0A5A9GIX4_AZOLI|nr:MULTISPECIES: UdgX family uracil-DNA binding protein [Azospirillum]KAA0593815.1 UdgX family uracil-DNA binding protein [Azospirillum lipoferum]MCP1614122.1 DNA polymerase [Azospirillum lipoferum]MDW5536808.1 UdgX family uracil-DNA binding protein [Azospirillum sp. NL1]
MHRIELKDGADLDGFRRALRGLVALGLEPGEVDWSGGAAPSLFGDAAPLPADAPPVSLPRAVGDLIGTVVCHRDPERYALLHRLVWRVVRGERDMLDHHADPLVHRLALLDKAVRRDLHKMHAFLRFNEVRDPANSESGGAERYVAWFEPDHFIVEATAPFFVERFESLVWTILTPVGSLHWDRRSLTIGPAAVKPEHLDRDDRFAEGWQRYYESTFNPARVNPTAMRAEMPRKYWANLPEAAAIPRMIRSAPARVQAMIEAEAAAPHRRNPDKAVAAMARQEPATLAELNRIILAADPLVPGARQAVLGEGPEGAAIAIVGEQPGDQEDVEGRPFVGPAGQLLTRALEEAGIERSTAYLTNAVKHFKFVARGKRRLHQSPTAGEVKHYRWWLMKELSFVRPRLVVTLGATAALALTGRSVPVLRERGPTGFGDWGGFVTVHPSYLLRLPAGEGVEQAYRDFVSDLRWARGMVESAG